MAALTGMTTAVIGLARLIESRYVKEIELLQAHSAIAIDDLKKSMKEDKDQARVEREKLQAASEKCIEDRYQLAIRVAQLESRAVKQSHNSLDRAERLSNRIDEIEGKE